MDDLETIDLTPEGIGDSMTRGQNVRHERGTKQWRMEDYSGIQRDSGWTPWMQWWLNSNSLNKGDSMMLPHKTGPVGTIKTWVQDGYSWLKSIRAWISMKAKWCPKYRCCKWRNFILRSGEVTLLGKNVSRWSIKSQKTKAYPFESSVRDFQWCWWFVKPS